MHANGAMSRMFCETYLIVLSFFRFVCLVKFLYVFALLKVLQAPILSLNDTQHGERASLECCKVTIERDW